MIDKLPELTEKEKDTLDQLRQAFLDSKLGLIRVNYHGEPRAVVVVVNQEGENSFIIPLAMLLDEAMFDQIEPPDNSVADKIGDGNGQPSNKP